MPFAEEQKEYDQQILQLDKKIELIDKELKPKDPTLFLMRGWAQFSIGQYKNAIADFTKVLTIMPQDPTAQMLLKKAQAREYLLTHPMSSPDAQEKNLQPRERSSALRKRLPFFAPIEVTPSLFKDEKKEEGDVTVKPLANKPSPP